MVTPLAKQILLTVLVGAFVVQTALVYSDELHGPIDDAAVRGRVLWHEYGCQVCHQLYGQGGFLGPDLTNAHRTLDSTRLTSLLTVGSGQMPAFRLDATDIADLRAYLRALDRPELGRGQLRLGSAGDSGTPWGRFARVAEPMMPDAASRGWRALGSRPCTACHLPLRASPVGAPDLSLAVERLTDDELRIVLLEGRAARGMPPPVPPFTPAELRDVMALVAWLGDARDTIAAGMREIAPSTAVRWSDIPWWEYP